MTGRMVSADEARVYIRMATPGPWAEAATTDLSESGRMAIVRRDVPDHVIVETGIVEADDANLMSAAPDLAHTVVMQAEQIAAALKVASQIEAAADERVAWIAEREGSEHDRDRWQSTANAQRRAAVKIRRALGVEK